MQYYYIVKFARFKDDEVQNYLLTEDIYDRWCECEPPQGYHCFVILWQGRINVLPETFEYIKEKLEYTEP